MPFILDPRLNQDTLMVADSDHCLCLLINDQRFPWIILVPTVPDISEMYQLPAANQLQLTQDSLLLGQEMMALFNGDKLNTGALGNIVRQLHLHHVIRFEGDAAWPGPVWGSGQALPYGDDDARHIVQKLRNTLTFCR